MIITNSPVQKMENLGKYLGLKNLYIKRDDLTDFYGNKTRHIKYILQNIDNEKIDTVVFTGGGKSNCMRIYGMAAKRMGYNIVYNFTSKPHTGNGEIMKLINQHGGNKKRYIEIKYDGMKGKAAQGFVEAAAELKLQLPDVDRIYLYSYDASWIGLFIGNHLNNMSAKIIAVRGPGAPHGKLYSTSDSCYLQEMFDEVAERNIDDYFPIMLSAYIPKSKMSEKKKKFSKQLNESKKSCVELREKSGRYGATVRKVLNVEGILLDPTYTGMAMSELIIDSMNGKIDTEEKVLFWHTGGIFQNV
jgi:D-cysteine desulfhydrase